MSIKSKFCAICGNEKNKFVGNTCVDCYFKTIKIVMPKSVSIYACPICDAINIKGFWVKADEDHDFYLTQALLDKIKLPSELELEDIEILQTGKEGLIQLNLDVAGKRFSVTKQMELYVTDKLCDEDSKRKREAYEGILQLRTDKFNVHEFIEKVLPLLEPFSNNVLKTTEVRNGADFYFIDANIMRQALTGLKKRIKLEIKESFQEYSWDKSKDRPKYKVTILAKTK